MKESAVKNSVDGSEKDIQVSGLFIAVGQEPDNYDFEEVVELDDKGYVIAGEDCKTESKGIFTAGDCRTKERPSAYNGGQRRSSCKQ